MKLNEIIWAVMVAATVTACNKESLIIPQQPAEEEIEFKTSIAETKTVLSGSKVLWMPGDEISVSGAPESFTTSIQENSAAASFKGKGAVAVDGKYYAVYPASGIEWKGASATMELPQLQSPLKGSFNNGLNLSYASTPQTEKTLVFHSLPGYAKFTIGAASGKIRKVVLSSLDNKALCGTFTLDAADGTIQVNSGHAEVHLSSENALEAGDYYVALLPGVHAQGLKIEFTNDKGQTASRILKEAKKIESGHIYDLKEVPDLWTVKVKKLFKEGTLTEGAYVEDSGMVNIADHGSITVPVTIPEDGNYSVSVDYWGKGPVGDLHPINFEIEGVLPNIVMNFEGKGDQVGVLELGNFTIKKGTYNVRINKHWNWMSFGSILFIKNDAPANISIDYTQAIYEGNACEENGFASLKEGNIKFGCDLPAAGKYRIIFEVWGGGDKINNVSVPECGMGSVEFKVVGFNCLYQLQAGTFTCDAPKHVTVTVSSNWGWIQIKKVHICPVL